MNESSLRESLSDLPLGEVRFFNQVGSTNDVALTWADSHAPDLSLVVAEEQTAGRGRGANRWFTPPGSALAFSLILRPKPSEVTSIPLYSALGALAVCQVIEAHGLPAQIKYPNDVLVNGKKLCGVLAESIWVGERVDAVILGIGLNIVPAAVPPAKDLRFPATSLIDELLALNPDVPAQSVDRVKLLRQVLQAVLAWRRQLGSGFFFSSWESRLAFRGEMVEIHAEGHPTRTGLLEGLGPDGSLWLRYADGEPFTIQFGEVSLRPLL